MASMMDALRLRAARFAQHERAGIRLSAGIVLGAISAFAFEPAGLWPVMILAFALLCWLVDRAVTLPGALLIGWGFGVGQFIVGLNWIATAFTFQSKMPAWLGWVAVVLLALYLAVYPMLAAGLAWRFGKVRPGALVLALAGGWAITEWLRATVFTGFAWNPIGVTLVDTPLVGLADVAGTYGLSALVVMMGGAIWLATRLVWLPAAILGSLTAILFLLQLGDRPAHGGKAIRVVQPNIGQEDKWREGLEDEAFARLAGLSAGGAPPPRLLLWPEVAVPEPFQVLDIDRRPLPLELRAIPRAIQSLRPGDVLLTGAFGLIADSSGKITGNTNSVYALDPAGRVMGRYDKAHLVPYGEYLPMRPLLTAVGLSQLAPGVGDTAFGPGPRTLDVGAFGRAGIQVCYEIIFSGQVVDDGDRPDFIFNPSNDAWFGAWGPPQHLAQARLRAAEEGLPVIRSTPTGISAVIDSEGRLLASVPWQSAGVIDAGLPRPKRPTPFARLGNIIPLALSFILLIAAIVLSRARRYSGDI